ASKTFLNLPGFAADDKRRELFVVVTGNTYTTKYADVATRGDWAPIIRYPEVLLTAAEASVRASNTVDAISLERLNLVRDRSRVSAAQYTLADFPSAQSFIDAVLLERRIELAFEGHRIEDLGRTKQGVTGKQADDYSPLPDVAYGANQLVFPIPEHDTKLNPNLKQNPGY
ncbi:MAG TPA: RagB/SusD family nutrient uptake outer membrane protein, partial [Pedobacter sp.]